jgi:hypothetical protein
LIVENIEKVFSNLLGANNKFSASRTSYETTVDKNVVYSSEPEGFLIVTREMFVDSLDDYVQWKTSMGFDVHIVTAESINDNVEGEDLRFKIRNCLRNYYYTENVKYAVLIGDSITIEFYLNHGICPPDTTDGTAGTSRHLLPYFIQISQTQLMTLLDTLMLGIMEYT